MKINSVFFGDNGVKSVTTRKTTGSAQTESARKTDSVTITGENTAAESPAVYSATGDFVPRAEKIGAARERIAQGDYNTGLIQDVAEKVADSPAVKDIVTEVEMNRTQDSGERADKIEKVREQMAQGYYDSADVRMTIAARLVETLGLTNAADRLM